MPSSNPTTTPINHVPYSESSWILPHPDPASILTLTEIRYSPHSRLYTVHKPKQFNYYSKSYLFFYILLSSSFFTYYFLPSLSSHSLLLSLFWLLLLLYNEFHSIHSESILVIANIGCELMKYNRFGGCISQQFIELSSIKGIILNEGFHQYRCIYYLAIITNNYNLNYAIKKAILNNDTNNNNNNNSSKSSNNYSENFDPSQLKSTKEDEKFQGNIEKEGKNKKENIENVSLEDILILPFDSLIPRYHLLLIAYKGIRHILYNEPDE